MLAGNVQFKRADASRMPWVKLTWLVLGFRVFSVASVWCYRVCLSLGFCAHQLPRSKLLSSYCRCHIRPCKQVWGRCQLIFFLVEHRGTISPSWQMRILLLLTRGRLRRTPCSALLWGRMASSCWRVVPVRSLTCLPPRLASTGTPR